MQARPISGGAANLAEDTVERIMAGPRARSLLDRAGAWSRRAPVWVGLVLVALGLWSIGTGLA